MKDLGSGAVKADWAVQAQALVRWSTLWQMVHIESLWGQLARGMPHRQGGLVWVVAVEAVSGGAVHIQRELDGVATVDAREGLLG